MSLGRVPAHAESPGGDSTDGIDELERFKAGSGLLPLVRLRPMPPRGGLSRPGFAAAQEPRHVPALPRRRRGAAGSAPALRRPERADAGRAPGQARAGAARAPARLPRDRTVPRSLVELEARNRLCPGGVIR